MLLPLSQHLLKFGILRLVSCRKLFKETIFVYCLRILLLLLLIIPGIIIHISRRESFFLFFPFPLPFLVVLTYSCCRAPYHPYGVPPQYADQYQRRPQGVGREEVLIVSDDRVLSLQPRGLVSQRHMADNVSMVSMPPPRS